MQLIWHAKRYRAFALAGSSVFFLWAGTSATQTERIAPSETLTSALEPDQSDVYPRAFFDRFAPQTAFDLLSRVPGFTIGTGAELRGFGGGAGNVLIDGDRPTVKAGG